MNILLVGAGGMGTTHYNNYRQIDGAQVAALVGTTQQDRDTAQGWGIPCFESIAQAVQVVTVDAADICVPTYLHKELALQAFACGLHVICEKPCALSLADGRQMFEAAKAAHRQLYVAQVVRFTPETAVLRRVIEEKTYGAPVDAVFERLSARPAWTQGSWLMEKEKSGLLPFDLHIHDLDLAVSLFGAPSEVLIAAEHADGSLPTQCRLTYKWADGMTASAEAAWFNACIPFTARWRVSFEKGMLIYDGESVKGYDAAGQTVTYDTTDPVMIPGGANLPANGWFYRELSHFVACAQQNIPSPIVTEEQVLAVLSVLEEISA